MLSIDLNSDAKQIPIGKFSNYAYIYPIELPLTPTRQSEVKPKPDFVIKKKNITKNTNLIGSKIGSKLTKFKRHSSCMNHTLKKVNKPKMPSQLSLSTAKLHFDPVQAKSGGMKHQSPFKMKGNRPISRGAGYYMSRRMSAKKMVSEINLTLT